ncbi:MAG: transcription termination/antitermination protein NusA [Candidatus Niyogibacteria bacterium]|nr:transcription termination/antitermination protein NusA [Candidatus Niyogibacteria bacterium]
MFDLKTMHAALEQLEVERGISKEKIIEAIEMALAAAYKKEYGERGQIVRATMDPQSGKTDFYQAKIVVDETMIKSEEEVAAEDATAVPEEAPRGRGHGILKDDFEAPLSADGEIRKVRFNPERHIMLADAKKIKKGVAPGEELTFPLEPHEDFGRIAAQTAKQVIIQRIREAERQSVFEEYHDKEGQVVSGIVQRLENRNVYLDLGRATGVLPPEEQVRGERYRIGERIKALMLSVGTSMKGPNLYLSRTHPRLVAKLFEMEVPEVASGTVEIKGIVREPGSRSKIAVTSNEDGVDPVGSCVGQKGVRVMTVTAELGGEKIDLIEWSAEAVTFIGNALSPARVLNVDIDEAERKAVVTVAEDQLSLAIGKGGQNVRLAARLTGWKIDIKSQNGEAVAKATEEGAVEGAEIETPDETPIVEAK